MCLLCGETPVFRALARSQVKATDHCLELGCSFGDTTVEIVSRAQSCFAVDNSPTCVQRASARCAGRARVEQHDAIGNPHQICELGFGSDAIFIDLGGVRTASAPFIKLVLLLQERLRPEIMVIKCREMHEAAIRAIPGGIGGGVVESSERFWSDLLRLQDESPEPSSHAPLLAEESDRARGEAGAARGSPTPADGELRICFSFLNKGRCSRRACSFRHLQPSHPDAVADAQKRSAISWQPQRMRGGGVRIQHDDG
jgi:hypothetical protein